MKHAEQVLELLKADKARKNTQTARILRHLITHKKGITSMTAFDRYGSTRLAIIISDLRHKYGVNVVTIREVSKEGQTYARYVLEEEESA